MMRPPSFRALHGFLRDQEQRLDVDGVDLVEHVFRRIGEADEWRDAGIVDENVELRVAGTR